MPAAPTTSKASRLLCANCGTGRRAVLRSSSGRKVRLKLCKACVKEKLEERQQEHASAPRDGPSAVNENGNGHESNGDGVRNYCNAKTRRGKRCTRPAGAGTSHVGFGRCKHHGGSTPTQVKGAAKLEAQHHAMVMGAPVDIEPHAALLWCVRIAAGEVAYCNMMVGTLSRGDEVGNRMEVKRRPLDEGKDGEDPHIMVEEITRGDPALHIWIVTRQGALDRLAKFSKLALDAGVAERQVQLAEKYGELIGRVIGNILDGLKLTPKQQRRAPELVREHLSTIEGTAVEVSA